MNRRKPKKGHHKSKNVLTLLTLVIVAITIVMLLLHPFISVNAADTPTITEFSIHTKNSVPYGITSGPDGNVWFTDGPNSKIIRMTPSGKMTKFLTPTENSYPWGITAGPDGNIWFTETGQNGMIGLITPSGEITEFPISTNDSNPLWIATGPDGNLWFTDYNIVNMIGRITPNGIVTRFPIPTSNSGPTGITAGPDGNIWFTENSGNKIGRITPNGVITEFSIPTDYSFPFDITAGPDGNLWFTENQGNKIGRITPNGEIVEFSIPTPNSLPGGITTGHDGNLWFTEGQANKIGRITVGGTITEFPVPTENSWPYKITSGPDGNIWFTENAANKIGRLNLSDQYGPDKNLELLSPFNNGVTWIVSQGYYNNRDQSKTGCHIGIGPDHCRNQLFGLDLVPDQQNDTAILAPGNGKVVFKGKLEDEDCIGLRITLDNGLNLNVCHFATFNIKQGDRIVRGKVLGTRSTPHVHLSLDDRYRIGTLCPGSDRCYLPVPFDEQHTIEGMSLNPNPNGETVLLPYPLCDKRKVDCHFEVDFQQYQGISRTSTNVAIL